MEHLVVGFLLGGFAGLIAGIHIAWHDGFRAGVTREGE